MALRIETGNQISRTLSTTVAGDDGRPTQRGVCMLSGQILPGKGLTLSYVQLDAQAANEAKGEVQEQVRAFWVELLKAAREQGVVV